MVEHPHEDSAEGYHDRRRRDDDGGSGPHGRRFVHEPRQAALDQTRTTYARHTASLRLPVASWAA